MCSFEQILCERISDKKITTLVKFRVLQKGTCHKILNKGTCHNILFHFKHVNNLPHYCMAMQTPTNTRLRINFSINKLIAVSPGLPPTAR